MRPRGIVVEVTSATEASATEAAMPESESWALSGVGGDAWSGARSFDWGD
jgi:hypothetical protein